MDSNKGLRVFKNAVAVVTGGASGIGKALAKSLANWGCEVVLADLQYDLTDKVAAEIASAGGRATAVKADVTDFPAIDRIIRETANRTGRLDFMFNNAGIGIGGTVADYGISDWNYILDVNLRGVIHGVQAAYSVMMRQGFGHIVNTASMAGLMPSPGMAAYSMTKHAVVGLSKALRAEASAHGVRVSVLCPGVIRTAILENGGKYGKMLIDVPPEVQKTMWEKMKPMAPDLFAEQALKAVVANEPIIIVPSWWKMIWRLHRFFPFYGMALAQKQFQDMSSQTGITTKIAN